MIEDERQRRWTAHCHRMADATQAIADWCEDVEMMRTYIELAAKWLNLAKQPPPQGRDLH